MCHEIVIPNEKVKLYFDIDYKIRNPLKVDSYIK